MSTAEKKTTVEIHLQPNARFNEITGFKGNILYIKVKAPPHKGEANKALLELLVEALAIPRNQLSLVRGYTSHNKLIAIQDIGKDEIAERLTQAVTRRELFK